MKRGIVVSLVLLVCCLLVQAAAGQSEAPRAEAFAGYSFVRIPGGLGIPGVTVPGGWEASTATNVNHWFGVEGQISGHYKAGDYAHSFLFGPRFSFRGKRVTPFAHALFGVAHFSGGIGTKFAMGYGGGLDYNLSRSFAIRAPEFDYVLVNAGSGAPSAYLGVPKVSAGVVFKFGNSKASALMPDNTTARSVASVRSEHGSFASSRIGVSGVGEANGIRVTGVAVDSPAAVAGIRVGDLIKSINGTPVQSKSELDAALANAQTGSTVNVLFSHSYWDMERAVTLR